MPEEKNTAIPQPTVSRTPGQGSGRRLPLWLTVLIVIGIVALVLAFLTVAAHAQKQMKVKPRAAALRVAGLDWIDVQPDEVVKRHIRITGGHPPYTCSLSSAPTWLSASVPADNGNVCELSGTAPPDLAVEATFTLNVADSDACTPVFQ